MHNYQELTCWKRAHAMVLRVYRVSKDLPQSENFGLILNLRRSVTAIATRIAEGSGRATNEEFDVELKRARAIGYELEYLLLVAHDLGFLPDADHAELTAEGIEIRKLISGLLKRAR